MSIGQLHTHDVCPHSHGIWPGWLHLHDVSAWEFTAVITMPRQLQGIMAKWPLYWGVTLHDGCAVLFLHSVSPV